MMNFISLFSDKKILSYMIFVKISNEISSTLKRQYLIIKSQILMFTILSTIISIILSLLFTVILLKFKRKLVY